MELLLVRFASSFVGGRFVSSMNASFFPLLSYVGCSAFHCRNKSETIDSYKFINNFPSQMKPIVGDYMARGSKSYKYSSYCKAPFINGNIIKHRNSIVLNMSCFCVLHFTCFKINDKRHFPDLIFLFIQQPEFSSNIWPSLTALNITLSLSWTERLQ